MRKLWVVTKNELMRYFISPLAYVYLIAFLLLNGSFAIYFGHFFDNGIADLKAMFSFQPWLYLLFIPGISMRLWSEEFRSKTVVQLLTMPVLVSTLVWGKFLASWLFAGLALMLTFPFWVTVNFLGQPDNAVILTGYIGSFILAGCMLAISQTMSALTKNQVIALVLAVVANFLFFLSGVEYVLGFFRLFASDMIVDMVASFSFLVQFGVISSGLIELHTLVFFLSVVLLFNVTTILIVSFKTSGTSKWLKSTQVGYYVLFFGLLLMAFVGLNLLSNRFLKVCSYDVTEEKLYTLSDSSKKILKNIKEPIVAKFYYSPILGQRNPEIRLMFERIKLLLEQFSKLEPDKFEYKIYTPQLLDDVEDEAIANGLQPIPLLDLNINGYFGLVMSDAVDKKQTIPSFALERYAHLEQDLIEKIYQIYHQKKTLGLISSLPIFETPYATGYVSSQWNIVEEIKKFYDIKVVSKADDLAKIDLLMILHPLLLTDEIVEGIKNYSLLGGKTLLLLDTAAEAPRIFSPDNIEFYPSSLNGLDKFWGFRFYNELVVADLENSITVDATQNYSSNPIFTQDVIQFRAVRNMMNPDFPVTKNLNTILFSSVSALSPEGTKTSFLPLIKGGEQSGVLSSGTVYDGTNPADLLNIFEPDHKLKFLSAMMIEKNSENPFEVIVVADTDFMYDTFWSKTQTVLDKKSYIPFYDNAYFVMNALDYLSRDFSMMDLRGKVKKIRRFDDIEKQRKNNLYRFRIKERDVFEKIEKTKKALQEVFAKKEYEERQNFTSDELALIARTRVDLENLRKELADIRINLNKRLDKSEFRIKFINICLIPIILLFFLACLHFYRFRKIKGNLGSEYSHIVFNREFKIVGMVAIVLICSGMLAFVFGRRSQIDEYENKKVFSGLTEKLNQIQKISLQSTQGNLDFYKDKNGEWKLKDKPCAVVYQERIKSFLVTVAEATYYEKKTEKVEYLDKFGLASIADKKSPAIEVLLEDDKGKAKADFVIGKYDIALGRGGRAAYMRFADKFQVWSIKADFIDLSMDEKDWTYSYLWNLRYGRLSGFNQNRNTNRTMELVKTLLNVPFENGFQGTPKGQKISSLTLDVEDNHKIKIDFWKDKDHINVRYDFGTDELDSYLKFFAQTAHKCFYNISQQDMEKIKNVLETVR